MTEEKKRYIAYYRVSTDKQGQLGLGMQSQQDIVKSYIFKSNGELINSYLEVASGKKALNRLQLMAALKDCKRFKATLIVAKLDRLARNVHFISGLQESRVKFVVAESPEVDETFILMGAVFAQHERRMISERTKAALAQAKKNGKILGNPHLNKINEKKILKSQEFAHYLSPILIELINKNYNYSRICRELAFREITTSNGSKKWMPTQIYRIAKTLNLSSQT